MKKIVWEKFKDPLAPDEKDEEDDDEEDLGNVKVLFTPQGVLPLEGDNLLSNKYNLWMVHVNFDLTAELVESLMEIPGIEALNIYSRYRMRIGFGKLFNEKTCKVLVEQTLGLLSDSLEVLDTETREQVDSLIESVKDKKNWFIYIYPNAEIVSFVEDNKEAFLIKLHEIEEVKQVVGGQLITHEYIS